MGKRAEKSYNKRMKKNSWFILTICAALCGCGSFSGQQLVGADRDEHDCIASAGYVWSQAQQKCLRVWEEGIQLQAVNPQEASLAAYVVLSLNGSEAEVFLPVKTKPVLLRRAFTPQGPYWTQENGAWLLKRLPEGWELWQKEALLYAAPNPQAD